MTRSNSMTTPTNGQANWNSATNNDTNIDNQSGDFGSSLVNVVTATVDVVAAVNRIQANRFLGPAHLFFN
jgi:hypothetical protein